MSSDATHDLLRFEVEDTGVGIAPQRLQRLFEAFEQGDPSTTRRHGGTGLGLAITRRLAELMDGEVGANSEPGRGSLFWFTVRLERSTTSATLPGQAQGEPSSPVGTADRQAVVLVVEDDDVNREVMSELLADLGAQVDSAADGVQALERIEARRPDLVLMDLQLPRLTGVEVTRRLRQQPDHMALPIVALSANVFEEDRRSCLEAGMNDFLSKPVDLATLSALLERWLAKGSLRPRPVWGSSAGPLPNTSQPFSADQAKALRATCQRLAALLRSGDMDASSLWAAERSNWAQLLGAGRADDLARLMSQFNYEQAAELLQEFLRSDSPRNHMTAAP